MKEDEINLIKKELDDIFPINDTIFPKIDVATILFSDDTTEKIFLDENEVEMI